MARDTSFSYSFLVLPPRRRNAIGAVWDFCRAVDDAVDEAAPGTDAACLLRGWRAELAACYEGEPTTPQGKALQPFIREFDLPRQPFDELIEGVQMDLDRPRYETFEELREYCFRVASAVGLVCVEIFGYADPRAREYAVNLGLALQLTNIIRDVAADLASGRVYLPLEDLRRFGCTEEDLRRGRVTPEVRALLEFECGRAHDYYRKADQTLPAGDARRLVAAEIMGGIYHGILTRIERSGYDVFSRRIRVPRPVRALIALRIWITGRRVV